MLVDLINQRKWDFAAQKAEAKRNKPMTQAQQRTYMSNYIKHMGSHTMQQLKRYTFDELKELFETTMKHVSTFTSIATENKDRESKLAAGSSKRRRTEHDEESVKKQKLEENDAKKEELRACLDIVSRDEIVMDFESLATKYLIIDWKTHILTKNMIQDVVDLHRLVQERYETTSPEGYDLLLWGDLKTLFEPFHVLLMDNGIAIHMMIEKKYPLTQEMLSRMINRRLEVDHESEMAFELLRFTRSQLKKYGDGCESKRKTMEHREDVTLGSATHEGELMFGVAYIFASFNNTFIDERDAEDAINALGNTAFQYDRRQLINSMSRVMSALCELSIHRVNAIDTVMDPSLCQGALGEIMADEVIVLLGGQLVPIGEVDQALCFNRRGGDQIREMDLNLHPELKESLIKLCNDLQTTIVVLSGSDRTILDDDFLRSTEGTWMMTMPEHSNMEWVNSLKYTQASDIWSIGCIYAEMVIGKPLFPGKTVVHQLDLMTYFLDTPPPKTIARVESNLHSVNSLGSKEPYSVTYTTIENVMIIS
ncbi:zinc finger, CCHC-type containing protein [Tanacetum coccineum]|uniref:Zinc finger, CCHC-type containing protein n=1 Tax=Tanacetum coccineum TaxID=301880 RepID=A0ABQ5ERD4_9ASTR